MEFTDKALIELVKIVPSILWIVFAWVVVILFHRPIRNNLLPKLSGMKAMGMEFSFVGESIDAALELADKAPQWKVAVPSKDRERVLNRAREHLDIFRGAEILWVDDHPENNRNERKMFHQLMAEIDIAETTEQALDMTQKADYDLILSDMARGDNATAGLQFLQQFREQDEATPVIYYVGHFDRNLGVPGQAFGITNRPDELLHLTLDALERKRTLRV